MLRLEELLFPSVADVTVLSVDVNDETVRIEACSAAAGAACPGCGSDSSQIHSFYLRFPADVPSAGRRVVLCLRVRRFFCRDASCERRTFVEQMPGLTRRYSRWTERLRSTLAAVGLALAGRAGARMASVFGVSVSRSTVLRLLDALPEPKAPAPRVVGVDEYATRKGRVYGTVLVDVEIRRPVDLLPDREASSLAKGLAKRPDIEGVCRDRAPFFAEGATAGAPQATQVADRWHLWHNLGEAAERAVARHRQCLRVLVSEPAGDGEEHDEPTPPEETLASPWKSDRFANRIRARHATVHAMLEAGHSRRSIGRQLHMTHRTVKSLADATRPEDLFHGQWQYNRTSALDDYKPYLDERWNEGATNAWKLWEEIAPLGYKGSYSIVSAYIRKKRTSPRPVTAQPPRLVTRWILSRQESLTEIEQLRLKAVLANCPELDALTGHVRSFATMLTKRQGERLPEWLDAVRQDELPSLHTLAAGIDRDRDAVTAGLALPWSSGVVEATSTGSRC
ncbi:transposase [Streptomyces sp. NBRC 13847]|uniref:ISL3 family transposase n=1 Tax=Streptomyces TaxID=1883 RepID=UPI0024A2ED70|nr:ISL3 family transposase [Streptomyces sp. NBRC 13847]GLW19694.1 transposase [Streptomyces sp. NBRC 13847]